MKQDPSTVCETSEPFIDRDGMLVSNTDDSRIGELVIGVAKNPQDEKFVGEAVRKMQEHLNSLPDGVSIIDVI